MIYVACRMDRVIVLPFALLVSAAFEEILIRGYLWNRLGRLTRHKGLALLLSATLFTAYHPYDLAGLVYIFAFGLVIGLFHWKGRSLPRLIVAHTLFNVSILYWNSY